MEISYCLSVSMQGFLPCTNSGFVVIARGPSSLKLSDIYEQSLVGIPLELGDRYLLGQLSRREEHLGLTRA